MRRHFFLILATLQLLCAAARAQPAPQAAPEAIGSPAAEQLLQEAEKYYEALEYEAALQNLVKVLQTEGVAPLQRARAMLYIGVCFTALGRAEDAVQAFMELLKIKPDFRIPDQVSPSIKAMFKEALTRLKLPEQPPEGSGEAGGEGGAGDAAPVSVEARAPVEVVAGKPIEVRVQLTDPKRFARQVLVRWRMVGGGEYSTIKRKHEGGDVALKIQIPGATLAQKKGKLAYFVEVQGDGGLTLAHAGKMDDPLKVSLKPAPGSRSTWGWWVLGVSGALVVAGGVVAVVMLTRDKGGPAPLPTTVDATVILK